MARNWLTGAKDRHRKLVIGSNVCCPGGVQKPYTPPAYQVSEADLTALEQQVQDLKRSLAGQAENRRLDEVARKHGAQ